MHRFRPQSLLPFLVAAVLVHVVASPARCQESGQETDTTPRRSLNDPIEETDNPVDDFVTPDMVAREAFLPPPGAKQLTKSHLWADPKKGRVYFDGYVAMRDGPLEMFACPMGTKEHESVVGTLPKASEVHAALLAIKARQGKPVQFLPKFVAASGQKIRVWVCWLDEKGKFHVTDARRWVRRSGTKNSMKTEWVFAGSSVWEDPADKRKYYQADAGDMICVSNFSTAMLDVNIASSAEADDLVFSPYTERIPDRFMPLRIVLEPSPEKDDQDPAKGQLKPPTKEILPQNPKSRLVPKEKPAGSTDEK